MTENSVPVLPSTVAFVTITAVLSYSSVGIATRYGLEGSGIEFRLGPDFPHPSRPALEPTQTPLKAVPCLFSVVGRPGRGANHPTPSSAEVKERVELYLYSPSVFVACSGANFTFL